MAERETNLYLIRHGQAVANVEPIIGGMKGDTGLTDLGVAQAERLRERLAATGEIRADALLASSLPRARQTAEIIAPALDLPVQLDDDLHELRPGDEGDGLSYQAYWARYGRVDLEAEPLRPIGLGGESWGQFTLRVGTALDRIAGAHSGRTVVIVCHGGVIDVSFLFFFGMPTLRMPPAGFLTHNTSITHWRQEPGRRWRLLRYNDDAHLNGLSEGKRLDWSSVAPEAERTDPPAAPLPTEEQ